MSAEFPNDGRDTAAPTTASAARPLFPQNSASQMLDSSHRNNPLKSTCVQNHITRRIYSSVPARGALCLNPRGNTVRPKAGTDAKRRRNEGRSWRPPRQRTRHVQSAPVGVTRGGRGSVSKAESSEPALVPDVCASLHIFHKICLPGYPQPENRHFPTSRAHTSEFCFFSSHLACLFSLFQAPFSTKIARIKLFIFLKN